MEKETARVLALLASPVAGGRTARLLDAFLSQLPCAAERIDVYRANFRPCTACGVCKTQEGCAFPDLDRFDRLLRASQLLVVASPVYNLSFPAPMKAVLDRFQRYYEARFSLGLRPPVEKHREAVLLTVSGTEDPDGPALMARQLRMAFSVMNTTLAETVAWTGTDGSGASPGREKEALCRAEKSALAIARKIW